MLGLDNGINYQTRIPVPGGMTDVSGQPSGSVALGDSGAAIILPNFNSVFQGSYTVSFWIKKMTAHYPSGGYLFGTALTPDSNLYIYREATGSGDFKLVIDKFTNTDSGSEPNLDRGYARHKSPNAVFDPADEDWKHVVFTADKSGTAGTNTVFKFYIDGSSLGTLSATSEITSREHGNYMQINDSATRIALGGVAVKHASGSIYVTNAEKGFYNELAIWNTDLNADNITAIYGFGNNHASSAIDLTSASGDYDTQGNLQGYWKLNDGAGATAAVDSTGGTNGVLINDPIFA